MCMDANMMSLNVCGGQKTCRNWLSGPKDGTQLIRHDIKHNYLLKYLATLYMIFKWQLVKKNQWNICINWYIAHRNIWKIRQLTMQSDLSFLSTHIYICVNKMGKLWTVMFTSLENQDTVINSGPGWKSIVRPTEVSKVNIWSSFSSLFGGKSRARFSNVVIVNIWFLWAVSQCFQLMSKIVGE